MLYTFSEGKSRDQEYSEFSEISANVFVCNAHANVFLVEQETRGHLG